MSAAGTLLIVGGSAGLGRATAEHYAALGQNVVVTSRDAGRAARAAKQIGRTARGLQLELSRPEAIAAALADVGDIKGAMLVAGERDYNTVADYDAEAAQRLIVGKIVGYTQVVHALGARLSPGSSVVLVGGLAKDRPYPGSTTITAVNEAISGLVRAMARELAPVRVNGLHPGVVGDHPEWSSKPREILDGLVARTPLGRLITLHEVALATAFLFEHPSVNGINLFVDGGWLIT